MNYLKSYDKQILDHYKRVAKNIGLDSTSTIEDPYIRESEIKFITLEIERIKKRRKGSLKILDLGCGNGYLLSVLNKKFKSDKLYGVEFCKELFDIAVSRKMKGVKILNGDCRVKGFITEKFDVVITERVIINILNRKDQHCAVLNILDILKRNGIYIMIESFRESFHELNKARSEMSLKEVPISPQNRYLNESFISKLEKMGLVEMKGLLETNFLSTYFYITRVFHKHIRPKGGRLKSSRMVSFFREALPCAIGDYSPIKFRVFKKD